MPWNKFVQYLIAFGIAFLVFGAVLLSENARFTLLSEVKNPFSYAKNIQEIVSVPKDGKVQELLLPNGELWILFPGSVVDFQNGKKEVQDGRVFVSGIFLKDGVSDNVQIGPLCVSLEGKEVFLFRDSTLKRSEIFAPVSFLQIYFSEESSPPFLLPHKMKVIVRDSQLSFLPTSYTEQKIAFEMENGVLEESFSSALEQEERWKKGVRNFVFSAPNAWIRLPEDNSVSRFIQFVKNTQNHVALGLSDSVREKRRFQSLLLPLVKSNLLAREGKTELATQTLEEFSLSLSNNNLQDVPFRNAELNTLWKGFFQAYEAWTRIILPEADDVVFFSFWREKKLVEPIKKLELFFSNIEKYAFRGAFADTQIELQKMNRVMMTEEGKMLKISDLPDLTRLRRLFSNMLLHEPFFQNEAWFEMYDTLVTKELELSESSDQADILREEISHEIFSFLQTFLENHEKIDVSKIILRSYQRLEIENMVTRLGRSIFSPEENELVGLVSLIGNTGLTKEELDAIRMAKENQEALTSQIEELGEKEEGQKEVTKIEGSQVANALYLKNLLEKAGVETKSMDFQTLREEGTTQFSNGLYHTLPVSGIFYYPTQLFQTLRVGKGSIEKINERFLKGFLQQAESESVKKESPITSPAETKNYISQTTPKAILERKLVQEILAAAEIKVSRDNIQVLDQEMNFFSVSGTDVYRGGNAKFVYNKSSGKIKDFTARVGTREVSFGQTEISFSELLSFMTEEIAKEAKKKILP